MRSTPLTSDNGGIAPMKLAIVLAVAAWLAMPSGVRAQDAPTACQTRCETRFAVCDGAAQALLEECLNRAQNLREKAICAKQFQALVDQCRINEASCLADCAD